MTQNKVSWHEGSPNHHYSRIIYLYIDGRLRGFIAELDSVGWLVYRFTVRETLPYLRLEKAKEILEELCMRIDDS